MGVILGAIDATSDNYSKDFSTITHLIKEFIGLWRIVEWDKGIQ